ncbi:P-II family nitrogen regulator [Clostridium formicaceticum]|uniref:Nitrogen regulatory protein P-II n=1 Tax=Clostridium formicaceticum TaxID=1497 RepID=A0AAC9RLE5_9CLOT|nr:P-II family nitrogen regulator [Clostridium formicaceticum]AOY76058.1 P-II family nitrogen regulator [Clostridium formicaceticum]ARE86420.1 Nitrogen regulatory protein P-II [Clostridium formicaceticum]
MSKIVKIEIITRQSKFEELKQALNNIGISGMTVTQVLGFGLQKGKTEFYRGTEYSVDLLPKVKVEVVAGEALADLVIESAKKVCSTGDIGDGKIFVLPVDKVVRIRTGEEADQAL